MMMMMMMMMMMLLQLMMRLTRGRSLQAQWRLTTAKKRQKHQERTAIETLIAVQPSNQQACLPLSSQFLS
jgi:hypothetical protein